jgi:TRAP-type C4-dicarboxylate transport system permease small subunit
MSDLNYISQRELDDPRDVRFVLNATSLLLAAIVTITFLQVTLRYFVGAPLSWGEELARYIFVWITFAGAAVAFARDTHIRVDALVTTRGPTFQRLAMHFRRGVELVAIAIMLYSGMIVAWRYRAQSFYSLREAPLVVFPLAIPVAALLMTYFYIRYLRVKRA